MEKKLTFDKKYPKAFDIITTILGTMLFIACILPAFA